VTEEEIYAFLFSPWISNLPLQALKDIDSEDKPWKSIFDLATVSLREAEALPRRLTIQMSRRRFQDLSLQIELERR
jgi:hypothetical protein